MSASLPFINVPGRLFTHADLYPGTPDPVFHREPVAVPRDVKIQERTDHSLNLSHSAFFRFLEHDFLSSRRA